VRKWLFISALSTLLMFSVFASNSAKAAPPAKAAPGSLVIVFKDGHRQTFNLSEIERVEFPGTGSAASADTPSGEPSRGRFVGKWEVGDGNGSNFYITLNEDGSAWRTLRSIHGKWAYVDGGAQVTWDDGAQDAIRRAGTHFQKYAYSAGKSFSDDPDNVTSARLTNPRPI
jgi:hypothetical protein